MTSASAEPPTTPATSDEAAGRRVPLSDVMLAMDVVDTLRHERALIERELNEGERRAAFIARVREVYEAQGIEVSDAVVAEGVDALLEDRFRYRPPRRTFAVRLAEIYVERAKWAKRAAVVAAIVTVAVLAWWIPAQASRARAIAAFGDRIVKLEQRAEGQRARATALERAIAAARAVEGPAVAAIWLDEADRRLRTAVADLDGVAATFAEELAVDSYPDARDELELAFAGREADLEHVVAGLTSAEHRLAALRDLRDLGRDVELRMAPLRGVAVSADDAATVERLGDAVVAALDAGDADAARLHLGRLGESVDRIVDAHHDAARVEARLVAAGGRVDAMATDATTERELAELRRTATQRFAGGDIAGAQESLDRVERLLDVLELEYELRIAKGRSGVWRHAVGGRAARNHYIIVEAVGPDGDVLRLPILNEENGVVAQVREFGVRVPEVVYERVKADKLDNGIVDAATFGRKRRGARDPEYEFEVAGGMITRW